MQNRPQPQAPLAATADELAAEFLVRRSEGEAVELDAFAARLADAGERARFAELVDLGRSAGALLPRALEAGDLLNGRYRVERLLGEGGMSRVFLARDDVLGRRVAIKVMHAMGRDEDLRQEALRQEMRALSTLDHPNIVPLYDTGVDGDLAYLVMRHVDGRSLDAVLERARELLEREQGVGAMPRGAALWERALELGAPQGQPSLLEGRDWCRVAARIVLELARTLEAAHARGVVHRDLKPSNVMLEAGGHPVVLDFGLAGCAGSVDGAVTQRLYGSAPYLAPEQAEREQVGKDPRTDVYQLGLVLYEMLVLQRAFPGAALSDVLNRVREGWFDAPRKRNPAVPLELDAICMRALERSPERRYRDAGALRADLEAYVSGAAVPQALRAHRWRALARGTRLSLRRHPLLVGAAAVALALGAGLLLRRDAPARFAPGDLQPYVLDTAGREVRLADGATVAPGDLLGVIVPGEARRYLYVLSVFENDADGRRCSPMKLLFADELSSRPERASFGLEVDACADGGQCPRVVCTQIEAHNRVEGLLIFSAREPRPALESWMSSLRESGDWLGERSSASLVADAGAPPALSGVDCDAALQRLFETTRGAGAQELRVTNAQREAALRQLRDPETWYVVHDLVPGVDFYKIECNVAGAR